MPWHKVSLDHLLESENSKTLVSREYCLGARSGEKSQALMARGGVSGQGERLKLGIQVGPISTHLASSSRRVFTECLLCALLCVGCCQFQGMLSNCLPSREPADPSCFQRVLAIDSDANGQITRQGVSTGRFRVSLRSRSQHSVLCELLTILTCPGWLGLQVVDCC